MLAGKNRAGVRLLLDRQVCLKLMQLGHGLALEA